MGTFATIEARSARHPIQNGSPSAEEAIERALEWFHRIEACCSRSSRRASFRSSPGRSACRFPSAKSSAKRCWFAIAVAEESGGASIRPSGPAWSARLQPRVPARAGRSHRDCRARGDQLSRRAARSRAPDDHAASTADARSRAVAKGLAIDMAARELDVIHRLRHRRRRGPVPRRTPRRWRALDRGIRHPQTRSRAHRRRPRVSNCAVCTSGDLRTSRCRRRWTSHHRCAEREARNRAGQRHRRGADRDARRCALRPRRSRSVLTRGFDCWSVTASKGCW